MTTKTKVKITPIGDRLLVKPVPSEEVSKGGVILPDSAQEKPQQGEVIAAGSGRYLDNGQKVPLEVKAGDKILYGKYSGSEIKYEGDEYLILKENEVLAILH